jgi:hypothetical protein
MGLQQDRENKKDKPLRGPHPPRWRPNPLVQHPPTLENIIHTQTSISTLNYSLLQHNTFIA